MARGGISPTIDLNVRGQWPVGNKVATWHKIYGNFVDWAMGLCSVREGGDQGMGDLAKVDLNRD